MIIRIFFAFAIIFSSIVGGNAAHAEPTSKVVINDALGVVHYYRMEGRKFYGNPEKKEATLVAQYPNGAGEKAFKGILAQKSIHVEAWSSASDKAAANVFVGGKKIATCWGGVPGKGGKIFFNGCYQ